MNTSGNFHRAVAFTAVSALAFLLSGRTGAQQEAPSADVDKAPANVSNADHSDRAPTPPTTVKMYSGSTAGPDRATLSVRSPEQIEAEILAQRKRHQTADARCLQLATEFRTSGSRDPAASRSLAAAVAETFDARQDLQRAELERMTAKLRRIEESLTARTNLRQRIIDRRVEELLDPHVDWERISGQSQRQPKVAGPGPGVIPATNVVASKFGTPIGQSGPPHIPIGQPAGRNPSAAAEDHRPPAGETDSSTRSPADGSTGGMLRDLMERRRQVELTAATVRDALAIFNIRSRPLDAYRKIRPNYTEEERTAQVKSAAEDLHRQRHILKRVVTEWQQVWRTYESQVRLYRLELEEQQSRRELALAKLSQSEKLADKGFVAALELQAVRTEFELADVGLKRAAERLTTYSSLEKELSHLNPESPEAQVILIDLLDFEPANDDRPVTTPAERS